MTRSVMLGPDPAFARALAAARRAPATIVFLAGCVALFVVAEQHGSTEEVETLVRFGATERGHVWAGEAWRLVTAAFLHIGVLHLVWNVVAMLGWCMPVERALGTARFVVLYLGAAIAASATSLVAYDVVGAGASGAGFGVVGASLALDARRLGSWRAFAADPGVRRTAGSAALWTLVLAGMGVDHAAHLGGLVAGLTLAWSLTAPSDDARARGRAWVLAGIVIAVTTGLALFPRSTVTRYSAVALESELARALEREDLELADGVLARAADANYSSAYVEYGRAFVLQRRGDLDGAARGFDALARSSDPEVRRVGVAAGKTLLAFRLANGVGMPADPERARKLLEEVCSSGDARVCELLQESPRPASPQEESSVQAHP